MTVPTTDALYLRDDLGAFSSDITDDMLNRNWARVSGASGTLRHDATLGLCFRQLWTKYGLLYDQEAGEVNEKLSQIVNRLERLVAQYDPSVEAALADSGKSEVGKTIIGAAATDRAFPT